MQTVQTTLTALAWYFILSAGFPGGRVSYLQVLAAYAAGVALNGFLPANIGTFVMLLMFVAMIPGANFPGVLGGMFVQKIFFTVVGTLVYLYLFLSVAGSFELQLNIPHDYPALTVLALLGGALLVVILGRVFWRKLQGLWAKAKQGGAILARPRDYFLKVFLPSFGAWLAKLGVIADLPRGLRDSRDLPLDHVRDRRQLACQHGLRDAGRRRDQPGRNVAALDSVTDPTTATAYSIGQQLAITIWNVAFGLVLVVWAFGWTGGKLLVQQSYEDAKVKVSEQKEQRAAKRAAKRTAG